MPLTRDAIAVTFAVPPASRARYAFEHGQFLTLRATVDGEELRRSYSICSPAGGALRVAIKRVPGGRFSTWAHDRFAPGTTVAVAPPAGRFRSPLEPQVARHHLAFAAGSGITPVISILATVLEREPAARFTLVYANRSSSHVMFRDELLDLKDRYLTRLALLFVMSREPGDAGDLHGRIDAAACAGLFARWIDASTVDAAYVCLPEPARRAACDALAAAGLAPEAIAIERFAVAPAGARATARAPVATVGNPPCEAVALLDGVRRRFEIDRDADESVLEAGLRQGLDLPYSCKSGVCSTCRARIVAGEVDMDVHDALEDYEIVRGEVLLCRSRAVTPALEIVVDGAA